MHCDLTIKQAARVAVSAGLSLALTLGSVPFFAYAETSDSIRAEMASVEAQLSTLYSEAEQCNYELQSVTAQLDKTNAEIDDLNVKIVETEEELVQAREDLSLTMSWSYRIRPDMISLILSSQSFEELVSNVYYANKVSSAQSEQIGHVKDLQEQQAQQKTDLETRKVEQEQLVADQQERADALAAATAELDSYDAGLSVELQEALAAEEAARQEAARQEAERRAAEEAAARAAAEAAAQNQNDNGGSSDSGSSDSGSSDSGSSDTGSSDTGSSDSSYSYDYSYTPTPTASATELVNRAYSVIGSSYTWSGYVWTGSTATSYFTCSGLVDYALGRPSWSSWPESLYAEVGSRLVYSTSQLGYGDLVFYSYAGRYPGHVGIYIGGGTIIDSCPGTGVAFHDVNFMDFIGGGPIV